MQAFALSFFMLERGFSASGEGKNHEFRASKEAMPHITITFKGTPENTSLSYELMDFLESNAPRLLGKTKEETLALFSKEKNGTSFFLPNIAPEKITILKNTINRLFPNSFDVESVSEHPVKKTLPPELPPEIREKEKNIQEPKTITQPTPSTTAEKLTFRETKKPIYKLLIYGFNPAYIDEVRTKAEKDSQTYYNWSTGNAQKETTESLMRSTLRKEFDKKISALMGKISYPYEESSLIAHMDNDFFDKLLAHHTSLTSQPLEIELPKNGRSDFYLLKRPSEIIDELKPLLETQIITGFKREKRFIHQNTFRKQPYEHEAEEQAENPQTGNVSTSNATEELIDKKGNKKIIRHQKPYARGGNSKPRRHDFPRKTIRGS